MGTGLSGGATALDGGIVLSTEKMRDISVDPVTRTAVAQPGLLNAEVKKTVAEYGLWYPPDPSSFEICSIGGNIATNAGGLCCVKYGSPPITCSGFRWCSPTAPRCAWAGHG